MKLARNLFVALSLTSLTLGGASVAFAGGKPVDCAAQKDEKACGKHKKECSFNKDAKKCEAKGDKAAKAPAAPAGEAKPAEGAPAAP